jgi:hypothetical protein
MRSHLIGGARAAAFAAVVFAGSVAPLAAQCTYQDQDHQPRDAVRPAFEIRQFDTATIREFKQLLAKECFTDMLVKYFGAGYNGAFMDWVIYIPDTGPVVQRIVANGHSVTRVKAQSYVWAVVISSDSLKWPKVTTTGITAVDTSDLRFSRRIIAFRRDPMITALIAGLAKGIGLSAPADAQPSDTVDALRLHNISAPGGTLFLGIARVSIAENTEVELSMAPFPTKYFDPQRTQAIFANVANAREHTFELGVFAGVSHGEPVNTFGPNLQVTNTSSRYAGNAYLTVVSNFLWLKGIQRPAWQRMPLGVFVGTNVLRGTIGDEVVYGGVLGRCVGNAGLVFGRDLIDVPAVSGGHVIHPRKGRWIAGLDLRF